MKKQQPEIFFAILILVFGIILILITPAGANFDEETYVARIWEMSLGHIMPNSYLGNLERFPSGFYGISYRRQINLPAEDFETLKKHLSVKLDENNLMKYDTRAMYFPTLFAVQAVVMRYFGPHLHYPILILYYLLRLSYVLIYSLLIFFTIKIIPFGKWVVGTLSIAPMCLIQAAAVSADSTIFGVSFLFLAWIVKLASDAKEGLTKKELIITCLLIIALGTLKPNAIFLLPLLIIVPFQRFTKNKTWLLILISAVVSIAISLSWSLLVPSYLDSKDSSGIDAMAQISTFFTSPQIFLKNLWTMLTNSLPIYYQQAVGVAGYGYYNLPKIIYWLFPFSLLLAIFSEQADVNLTIKQRVLFGLIGLFNFLMIFVVFFIVVTPVGSTKIEGIQGRYFETIIPLLIIPFLFRPKINLHKMIIGTVLVASSLIFATSLFLSYHVVCGYAMSTNQTCALPYYKNWDASTFLGDKMDKNASIRQSAVITCKKITGIQVWVNKNDSPAGQKLFFSMKNEAGVPLQTSWLESEKMPQNGWGMIELNPPLNWLNQALQFEISSVDGKGIPGLELGYFPTNEFNRGSLLVNGKEINNDLVFKYICADDYSTLFK